MLSNATHPFNLDSFPPKDKFDGREIINLLIKARAELGELKGYTLSIPSLSLFSPVTFEQSLASSEMEGINTTIIGVLQSNLLPKNEQCGANREVLQYRKALIDGYYECLRRSITTEAICKIHSILLPNESNDFRKLSGQIVSAPPAPAKIPELMNNLEKYINKKNIGIDPLIKSILIHYQLVVMHPFCDGNSRMARIIMNLLLVQEKISSYPIVYISGYIYKNRNRYFRHLLNVALNDQWEEYVKFMLKGFYIEARETKNFLISLTKLFRKFEETLKTHHKKIYSPKLIETFYIYPIITSARLARELGIHYTTAGRYLNELKKSGILVEERIGKYNFFSFKELVKLICDSY